MEKPKFPEMTEDEKREAEEIARALSSGPHGKMIRAALSSLVQSGKALYISIESGKMQIVVKKKLQPYEPGSETII